MPTEQQLRENPDLEKRMGFLRKFGTFSMAYSTLKDGLDHFVTDQGYLAFAKIDRAIPFLSTTHVLANPVTSEDNLSQILRTFLSSNDDACFWQVDKHLASILRVQFGFYANKFGTETLINTMEFTLKGKEMEDIRRYRNVCSRANVVVEEKKPDLQDFMSMRVISEEWIDEKVVNSNELSFLARPMVYEQEVDVRYRVAKVNGQIMAFAVYEPMYKYDQISGYQVVIQRACPGSPKGIIDFIHLSMIESLKNEGISVFSLGLSPFSDIDDSKEGENPFTASLFRNFYKHGNNLFGFKNLEFHKERYRGQKKPVYFCSLSKRPIKQILDAYRLCGVITLPNSYKLARAYFKG